MIDLIFMASSLTIDVATMILRKIAWKRIFGLQNVKHLFYYFAETESNKI